HDDSRCRDTFRPLPHAVWKSSLQFGVSAPAFGERLSTYEITYDDQHNDMVIGQIPVDEVEEGPPHHIADEANLDHRTKSMRPLQVLPIPRNVDDPTAVLQGEEPNEQEEAEADPAMLAEDLEVDAMGGKNVPSIGRRLRDVLLVDLVRIKLKATTEET